MRGPRRAARPGRADRPGRACAATFALDAPADLFLDTAGWGKGYAWSTGSSSAATGAAARSGRCTCPRPLMRAGENTVVIVELEAVTDATARFLARPDLGHEVE